MSLPIVPGASGYGMDTRAAYGGVASPTVLRVTNINDSGAGSLRAACEGALGPRVVVFETSGTIPLSVEIVITDPYITIAGQTAPSPGITLKNYGLQTQTHDVLIQHLRIRPGGNTCNTGIEAFQTGNPYNIVFDHCSVSWSQSKNFAFTNSTQDMNTTIWRCFCTEPTYAAPGTGGCSGGGFGYAYGMLFRNNAKNAAVIQSLFAHCAERNPEGSGSARTYSANNLIYDWLTLATIWEDPDGAEPPGIAGTHVSNYYRTGPSTTPTSYLYGSRGLSAGSEVYIADTTSDYGSAVPPNGFVVINNEGIDPQVGTPPMTVAGFTPMASSAVYAFVLANAGARPLDRDSVDTRIVSEVQTRTGQIISTQADVGGWPVLAVNTRAFTTVGSPNTVTPSGYTNLELQLQGYASALETASALYVATTGSDSNPGTLAAPFQTIARGVSGLSAGNTLWVRGGTYPEAIIDPPITGISSSSLITIAAYPNETVWLKPPSGAGDYVIDLSSGTSYVTFDGINLDASNAAVGTQMGGLRVDGDANNHHITFKNARVVGNRLAGTTATSPAGIMLQGATGSNTLTNVVISGSGGSNASYGLVIGSDSNVCDGLNISDVSTIGIRIDRSVGTTASATIKNSRVSNITQGVETYRHGILVVGDNHLITNTQIYNINSDSSSSDVAAVNIYSGTNCQLLNCTITNNPLAFGVRLDHPVSPIVRNNIIFNNPAGAIDNQGATGTPILTPNTLTDPLFVNPNPAVNNFQIQPSSPAVGSGTVTATVPVDTVGASQAATNDTGAFRNVVTPVATTTTITTVTPAAPPVSTTYAVTVTVAPTAGTSRPSGTVTVNDGVGNVSTVPVVPSTTSTSTVIVPMATPQTPQAVTLTATFAGPVVTQPPFSTSTTTAAVTIGSGGGTIPSPPPTNISFATAIDLGSLPVVNLTQRVDAAGTTHTVYYKFTAASTAVLSVFGYGDAAVYKPNVNAYHGPVGAPVLIVGAGITQFNRPIELSVVAGTTYFLEFNTNAGNPSPANLTLNISAHTDVALVVGDFAVCDDTSGFPMAFASGTVDYAVHRFIESFPSSEQGDVLTNGVVLIQDIALDLVTVKLYNASYSLQTTQTFSGTVGAIRTCGGGQVFYVGYGNAPFSFATVNVAGVKSSGTIATGSAGTLQAIAASNDQSILYHAPLLDGTAVHRTTIATGAALSDLVAGIANYRVIDILILKDNTILVGYSKSTATADYKVLAYNAAGATLHTYTIGQWDTDWGSAPRLATAIDDPNSFWVMFHPNANPGETRFLNIKVSDGSTITTRKQVLFSSGVSLTAASPTPTALFGTSPSCPFWIVRAAAIPLSRQAIRRQRRFLLPSSPDNTRVSMPTLEVLLQGGIGLLPDATGSATPLGVNPQVMMRLSKDGGKTWGPERVRSAGEMGQYLQRARWLQATGNYRNAVCEITVSDPNDWQFIAALGTPIEGTS